MTCYNYDCYPPAEGSRVLEKVDPHSCSTSRSDSPVEPSERKKKHKRKDKEKREKVRSLMEHPSLVVQNHSFICAEDTQVSCLFCSEEFT